jgi:hypothetical protein
MCGNLLEVLFLHLNLQKGEIVQTIIGLKAAVERSGTLSKNKPRRVGRIV